MPLLTDDTIRMRLPRLALLGLLVGCLGCEQAGNPLTPSHPILSGPTAPVDPEPTDEPRGETLPPPPQDDTLYWIAAPGCTPRPGQPELGPAAQLRRDHITDDGTKRILTWYIYGPEWFIDAVFHRADGKWLVCFWDTRG